MRFTIALVLVLAVATVAFAGVENKLAVPTPTQRGALICDNAIPIMCGETLSGDNTGLMGTVTNYSCTTWNEGGGEMVYEVTLAGPECYTLTAELTNMSSDLDIFILGSCDETDCMAYGDATATSPCLEPGTYYVVVDAYGSAPTGGAFDVTVTCDACDCPVEACCPFPYTCVENDFNVSDNGVMLIDCGEGPNPWAWGVDAGIPQVACDDVAVTNILGTVLGGTYGTLVGGAAAIGPFDITESCSCLELCHYYDTESGFDGGNVKVSTDGGATWQLITPSDGYDDILDSTYFIPECVAGELVFTGDSVTFVRDCFVLDAFIGQQVMIGFFFGCESYETDDLGWYIKWAKIGGTEYSPVQDSTWGSIKSMYR